MWLLLFALACVAGASSTGTEPPTIEVNLAPLEVFGTPTDLLQDDPVVPVKEGATRGLRSEGSIHQDIGESLGLPAADYGTPGGLSQFRGLGRSASETDVHSLGVPLNLPHGVGFDFSVFPQFLWSGFRYQGISPSGSRDPRASGASVALVPWTYDALETEGVLFRASHLESTLGLRQSAVAAAAGKAAVNVGYSDGSARGVSGSAGVRVGGRGADTRWLVHVLATGIEADSPGPSNLPTPNATQSTMRVIPFIQMDTELGATVLKHSVFFDRNEYEYSNPGTSYLSRVDSTQWGMDSAVKYGDWRIGGLYRQVEYETADNYSSVDAPTEYSGRLELGRVLRSGLWIGDLSGALTGVSRFGLHPGVGLGVRRNLEVGGDRAVYFRGRFDRRIPTLSDRYFDTDFFDADDGLEPERIVSGVVGWEVRGQTWSGELSAEAQWISDAMVLSEASPFVWTVRNQGDAWRLALRAGIERELLPGLRGRTTGAFSQSRILATGLPYPYLPELSGTAGLERDLSASWVADVTARISGRSPEPSGGTLAGYLWLGMGATGRILGWNGREGGLDLGIRVENALDKSIELVKYYPLPGRAFTVSLSGSY